MYGEAPFLDEILTFDLSSDLVGQRVCVESFDEPNKELPPMRLAFCLSKPSLDEQIVEVLCSCGIWEGPGSALMERSLRFYELKVVPRIITWCEASNSVAVESRPNQAPGVPSTSLKFVPVKSYFEVYKRLKDTYFARLQSVGFRSFRFVVLILVNF